MIYKSLTFKLNPSTGEYAEILSALLDQEGFEGIFEENDKIIAYIPKDLLALKDIETTVKPIINLGCRLEWTEEEIQEKNWNEVWESNFDPVVIDNRCAVRAPFHKTYEEVSFQITIEPKMSFGTGHHQTTRMMLEKILDLDVYGKNILDMGCGTGVLSILSSMKGASHITAIDIDTWAVENTNENILKNNAGNIKVLLGGKEAIPSEKFDIILANINRNILLDQLKDYFKVLVEKGILILSGILMEDIAILTDEARKTGFTLIDKNSRNNWALLMFERN